MVRYGVYPFVERRIELGDDVLLPLLSDETQERLRLIDRVLESPRAHTSHISTTSKDSHHTQRETFQLISARRTTQKARELTIVRIAKARI